MFAVFFDVLLTACRRKRVCKLQFCICCFIRTPIVCAIFTIFTVFEVFFIDYVISFFDSLRYVNYLHNFSYCILLCSFVEIEYFDDREALQPLWPLPLRMLRNNIVFLVISTSYKSTNIIGDLTTFFIWISSQNLVAGVLDFLTAAADSELNAASLGGALWTVAELSRDFRCPSWALGSKQRNNISHVGERTL